MGFKSGPWVVEIFAELEGSGRRALRRATSPALGGGGRGTAAPASALSTVASPDASGSAGGGGGGAGGGGGGVKLKSLII